MRIVVAAGILRRNKNFLLTSRPKKKSFAGFWEFPGGKVKKNELLLHTLKREIFEELTINLDVNNIIFFCNYRVARKNVKLFLNFFLCYKWSGTVNPTENQKYVWLTLKELEKYNVLKSNRKVLDKLNTFYD
tara:strand:+ start:1185 stop:1580 length:396 start_codon:yes stop_codon:yes gene_type:complete